MNKKEKKKHGMSSYTFRRKVAPWCILAPPIFFTLWLKYYPIVSAFFISLFKYDPINPPGKFVGFKNYQDMFQMDFYWQSWKNTLIFLLLQLAMCFFIPLIQALLLNELQRLQKRSDDVIYSSGADSYFCKCNYMEMDMASGLWCCKSDCEVFRWGTSGMVKRS